MFGIISSIRLFTDDCAIFMVISCIKDCEDLRSDFNRLYYRMQLLQLTLNQSKCKVMRITNKRRKFHYTYSLNSAPLEWVDTLNTYLELRINSKPTWTDHLLNLRRNMQGCSKQAKARAFTALVHPILRFARQFGLPICQVPRKSWKRSRRVQLDGYVHGGTRRTIAGPKLMRNASPILSGPQSDRGISCSRIARVTKL